MLRRNLLGFGSGAGALNVMQYFPYVGSCGKECQNELGEEWNLLDFGCGAGVLNGVQYFPYQGSCGKAME